MNLLRMTMIELFQPDARTVEQGQRANTRPKRVWRGKASLWSLTAAQGTRALGIHADRQWTCHVQLPRSIRPTNNWTIEALGKKFQVRNVSETLFWTLDLQEA